jgi:hypothetical protein
MGAALLSAPAGEMSPRGKARLAAVFFLLTIVAGIIAQAFISEQLVVSGDARATAANILSQEALFRLAFTVYLIEMACQIVMTALFYDVLKAVSRSAASLFAVFSYVGAGIKTLSRLFFIAPLLVLGGAPYLTVFSADQREALALLFLRVNDQAAAIALVFFGFATLFKGYLVYRSSFLPRWLGVAIAVAGMGWLAFLSPPLGIRLFPIVAGLGVLTSLATIVWLLVFGVNEERWIAQANSARVSIWA